MKKKNYKYAYYSPILGCDPEFFFDSKNGVVGAEKILPKEGIKQPGSYSSNIIIDGVQAELNPPANTCRALLGNSLKYCFVLLKERMSSQKGISVNITGTVVVPEEEFKTLSEESKVFGCMPDINAYKNQQNKIEINPKVSRVRTAGGHLHVGAEYNSVKCEEYSLQQLLVKKHSNGEPGLNLHQLKNGEPIQFTPYQEKLIGKSFCKDSKVQLGAMALALQDYVLSIKLMDIIVGNTCVMLDTDPANAERRKIYGKAGDFRLTNYGLEYRTLSNFWLRDYKLMSLVTGLVRTAVTISTDYHAGNKDLAIDILNCVKEKDIINAINNNDVVLAKKNFLKLAKILEQVPFDSSRFPIQGSSMVAFLHFVNRGLDYWFKSNPIESWTALSDGHGNGFESFTAGTITTDLEKFYGVKYTTDNQKKIHALVMKDFKNSMKHKTN